MLNLVLADRNETGVIEPDVGSLQHRIVQQPCHDAFLARGLVLELRLPLELAHGRHRVENPGELGMFGNLRLHEECAARGVDSGGEQRDRHVAACVCADPRARTD